MTTRHVSGNRREYTYPLVRYLVTTVIANILLLLLLGWAVFGYATDVADWRHRLLLLTVPLALASAGIGLHLPSRVGIDDEGIDFSAFRRRHRYSWSELEELDVRPFPLINDRFLVNIGNQGLFRGRYWIHLHINGYAELRRAIEDRADELFPDRPRVPARRRGRG